MSETILIVEDDESILAGLRLNLEMEGFRIVTAQDGQQALRIFETKSPDLVILDIMLPTLNGFEVLEKIRVGDPDVSVLLLSARDTKKDKILGLGLGADDYVTKPFQLDELIARINAALRRKRLRGPGSNTIRFADIVIDLDARRVARGDEAIEMTTREHDLLAYMARRPERVFTRAQILDAVWGDDYEGTERTVDNFIARLRTKIEVNPEQPLHIQTVRGVGYRFVA